jgi:cation:H+ antiporter
MPEVATSIVAAIRKERDIAVGNVVGSNITNILLVLGLTSSVAPAGIDVPTQALLFGMPVMIAAAVVGLPIFFTGGQINRWEGALLLAYYFAYTSYLILDAANHEAMPVYSLVMLVFVVPLTSITLLILAARAFRARKEKTACGSPGPQTARRIA